MESETYKCDQLEKHATLQEVTKESYKDTDGQTWEN